MASFRFKPNLLPVSFFFFTHCYDEDHHRLYTKEKHRRITEKNPHPDRLRHAVPTERTTQNKTKTILLVRCH